MQSAVRLAVTAPPGPPASAAGFLERLEAAGGGLLVVRADCRQDGGMRDWVQ